MQYLVNQLQALSFKVANLRKNFQNHRFNECNSVKYIISLILSDENIVMNIKEKFLKQGLIVYAIYSLTVSPRMSRLRIALNINHTENNLIHLIYVLQQI
ncbi:MAG: hypothetical protein ACR5KW_03925 [Wolbachia sp.]